MTDYDPDFERRRARNIEVFQETMRYCHEACYTAPSGRVHYSPDLRHGRN